MKYISTRGGIEPISFKEAVFMGLASDGGLLLPRYVPTVSRQVLEEWKGLGYQELALEVMDLFIEDIPKETLRDLIQRSYASFDTDEVVPLVQAGQHWIMELFHGPTLAFKDIALQFLGNLFSMMLEEQGRTMNILGATSGDTGSAAIYGVKGKDNINIFILHPHGRVSRIQALQMTTVAEENVFNIAVKGTFDDCQAIVKEIFNDLEFKKALRLGAINSINWARVLAQVVYYVYSALRLQEEARGCPVHFAVPTGNFGDIFAGFVARKMTQDLIGRLILATNENNILTRFVLEGKYERGKVVQTISPSMDIQIASNFERYLFYLMGQDPQGVKETMAHFSESGKIVVDQEMRARVRDDFSSASIDQAQTVSTIRQVFQECGYVLDPHTAVGVAAARRLMDNLPEGPVVCLATAHPAKFPEAVKKAIGKEPERPKEWEGLEERSSRLEIMEPGVERIKDYIRNRAR